MNSLEDLAAVLDSLGIPWTNGGSRDGSAKDEVPPYIDIEAGYGDAVCADNKAWVRWMPYDVALYVRERDYQIEQKIETALDDADFAFTKTVTPIDGEDLIETAYKVNVFEH